jgi:hypothetical protein
MANYLKCLLRLGKRRQDVFQFNAAKSHSIRIDRIAVDSITTSFAIADIHVAVICRCGEW